MCKNPSNYTKRHILIVCNWGMEPCFIYIQRHSNWCIAVSMLTSRIRSFLNSSSDTDGEPLELFLLRMKHNLWWYIPRALNSSYGSTLVRYIYFFWLWWNWPRSSAYTGQIKFSRSLNTEAFDCQHNARVKRSRQACARFIFAALYHRESRTWEDNLSTALPCSAVCS